MIIRGSATSLGLTNKLANYGYRGIPRLPSGAQRESLTQLVKCTPRETAFVSGLFDAHEHTPEEISLGSAMGKAKLLEQNTKLQRMLEERKVVERAKGLLQRRHNLTEEETYLQLRSFAQRSFAKIEVCVLTPL